MKSILKTHNLVFMLTILTVCQGLASPMPATSSSALITGKQAIIYSDKGFALHANGTDWNSIPTLTRDNLVARFEPANISKSRNASLTVRVDQWDRRWTIQNQSLRWTKDYQRLGFEILGKKAFHINKQQGYLMDLKHTSTQRQVRQAVFFKETKAVVLTCRDDIETFSESLKDCNQIIRSFHWTMD